MLQIFKNHLLKLKALQYLNKYFLKYKWRFLAGLFITVLSKLLALQVPRIIGGFFERSRRLSE